VKVLITHAGPHGSHPKGEVVDLPADEARRLVALNYAEPVADSPVETASAPADVETATEPAPKPRRSRK
jgi:hypothetical protein